MDHTMLNDTLFMHLAETDVLNVALKNSWNHIKQYKANLFLAGFRYLNNTVRRGRKGQALAAFTSGLHT